MIRQRSTPWIQRKSRFIIAGIGAFGAAITAYLAATKLAGGSAACPVEGCDKVLESPYAEVFGLPLALFGFLAYAYMIVMAVAPLFVNAETQKGLRTKLEHWTWLLMFVGSASMAIFSGYLMYIMAFEIRSLCVYCIASAIASLSLLVLTLVGRDWDDIGQLIFIGLIVAMATIIGTLAVYAPINNPSASDNQNPYGITTASNPSNIALAEHLTDAGAVMYGAFWCAACKTQKEWFGRQAAAALTYIECDAAGQDPQPDLCRAKGIEGYPTWEIDGKMYTGVLPLKDLADLSGYTGPRDFGN